METSKSDPFDKLLTAYEKTWNDLEYAKLLLNMLRSEKAEKLGLRSSILDQVNLFLDRDKGKNGHTQKRII